LLQYLLDNAVHLNAIFIIARQKWLHFAKPKQENLHRNSFVDNLKNELKNYPKSFLNFFIFEFQKIRLIFTTG